MSLVLCETTTKNEPALTLLDYRQTFEQENMPEVNYPQPTPPPGNMPEANHSPQTPPPAPSPKKEYNLTFITGAFIVFAAFITALFTLTGTRETITATTEGIKATTGSNEKVEKQKIIEDQKKARGEKLSTALSKINSHSLADIETGIADIEIIFKELPEKQWIIVKKLSDLIKKESGVLKKSGAKDSSGRRNETIQKALDIMKIRDVDNDNIGKVQNEERIIALAGVNLQYNDFGKGQFPKTSFAGSNLYFADLPQANLKGAFLQGTKFHFADLSSADLSNTHMDRAELKGAKLINTNLKPTFRTSIFTTQI